MLEPEENSSPLTLDSSLGLSLTTLAIVHNPSHAGPDDCSKSSREQSSSYRWLLHHSVGQMQITITGLHHCTILALSLIFRGGKKWNPFLPPWVSPPFHLKLALIHKEHERRHFILTRGTSGMIPSVLNTPSRSQVELREGPDERQGQAEPVPAHPGSGHSGTEEDRRLVSDAKGESRGQSQCSRTCVNI